MRYCRTLRFKVIERDTTTASKHCTALYLINLAFICQMKVMYVPKVNHEHVESEALEVEIILLTQECIILSVHTYFCGLKAGCLYLGNLLQPSTGLRCDLLSDALARYIKSRIFLRQHHFRVHDGGF